MSSDRRHVPESVGITLNTNGWVRVDVLLAACARHGQEITRLELEALVAASDKRRFAFDEGHARIRAQQGHWVSVELDHPIVASPDTLYHGTGARYVSDVPARFAQA